MLWALHIPDGMMRTDWLVAGFVGLGFLYWLGARKIRDEEIPRIALLTAVFFVVSTIHVRIPGSSVHLLGNALVGIVLGRRAGLAISVGLLLQALLLFHGGYWTIGVNSCVMTLPALLAWLAFRGLHRWPWITRPWCRALLVGSAILIGILSLIYGCRLVIANPLFEDIDPSSANALVLNPWVLLGAVLLAAGLTWLESRMENAPEFPIGFLIGELTVLATACLSCLALIVGALPTARFVPLVILLAHIPLAVLEGAITGVVVGFLMRVKPEMLKGPLAARK